jgi:cytochrome P450
MIVNLMHLQTCLSVNAWVIHRNKDIFGDDAESFNPERWLDAERVKLMDKFLIHVRYLVISSAHIARLEI